MTSHPYDGLPTSVPELCRLVQGLAVHEFMAADYGVTVTEEWRDTVNRRPASEIVDAILALSGEPLTVARPPQQRIATNCRGFSVLLASMLRAQGAQARVRCGFGTYFKPGFFEDHWVTEYRDGDRWRMVDAQIDEKQRGWFDIDFDLTDVPADRFVVAGQAWQWVRDGKYDASQFGLSVIGEAGDWWIAANLMRDAAALRGTPLLPWDSWGDMPGPSDEFDPLPYDALAAATLSGSDFSYEVPAEVYNFQHQQTERVPTSIL